VVKPALPQANTAAAFARRGMKLSGYPDRPPPGEVGCCHRLPAAQRGFVRDWSEASRKTQNWL